MNKEETEMAANHIHERVGLRLYQIAEQLEHLKILLGNSQQNEEKELKEKRERSVRIFLGDPIICRKAITT